MPEIVTTQMGLYNINPAQRKFFKGGKTKINKYKMGIPIVKCGKKKC